MNYLNAGSVCWLHLKANYFVGLLLKEGDLKIIQEHTAGTRSAGLRITSTYFSACMINFISSW